MKHLTDRFAGGIAVAACGKKIANEKDTTFHACDVTCPQCMKTKEFAKAATHPFYGVPPVPMRKWENEMF